MDYSKTPLIRKLGIKEKFRCRFIHAPSAFFDLLGALPDGVECLETGTDFDYVHLFAASDEILDQYFAEMQDQIKPNGMIWISWYKKSSGKASNVNGNIIRGTARSQGLIDAKVCSINEDWSALKLVIRKENR